MVNYANGYSPVDQNLNQEELMYTNYPQIAGQTNNSSFHDEFNRATLNPTGGYAMYATAGTGTEVITIALAGSRSNIDMLTGGTTGNDVSIRTAEYWIERNKDTHQENRSAVNLRVLFQTANAVTTAGFVGLMLGANAALTDFGVDGSTTAGHMGVAWDTDEAGDLGDNYQLTSSDGTTQTLVDSGVAIDTADHNLSISWTGNNAAVLSLVGDGGTNATVTALNTQDVGVLHFFVQALTNSARRLRIIHWTVASNGTFEPLPV